MLVPRSPRREQLKIWGGDSGPRGQPQEDGGESPMGRGCPASAGSEVEDGEHEDSG